MSLLSRQLDPVPALKAQLAAVLVERLHGLPRDLAATYIGLTPARVTQIRGGHLDDFSLQRLVRCLYRLGNQLEITVLSNTEVSLRERREEAAQRLALVQADRARIRRLADKRRMARQPPRQSSASQPPRQPPQ